jgi:hypothetical protein
MNLVHTIAVGDTRTPFGFKLRQDGKPVDLSDKTVKVIGKKDNGDAWIAEVETTKNPTREFTVETTNNWILDEDHKAEEGDQIIVSSTTTLPGGLTAATRLFVRDAEPNRFKVAEYPGGPAIDITSAGTGTHSYYIVGSGQYAWQDADVAAKGVFWLWVRVYDGEAYDTFPIVRKPNNRGLRIEIGEVA